MSDNKFPRGSEWRKWDLHVHTPLSIEQHYWENNEETWKKYIEDLEKLPKDFSVLWINDYLFLDWYEKILKEKNSWKLKNIDLILPVLEFRIEKFAWIEFKETKRINLHVIFSNELSIETIKSQFLNTLEQSYTIEKWDKWTRAITRESVSELWKTIKSSISENELWKYWSDLTEWFNNLNVSERQIFQSLEKDCFKGMYLIAIWKTEWDQLKWTDWSIATKKSIINEAHIVFTSSESIEKFNNAKSKLTEQKVNNLLLDCSDAHRFSDSKDKDRIWKCFTWIKADPTFEWLKQIIYEPIERVEIQANKPEEKTWYRAIDKIIIKDCEDIEDSEIVFNQNLNTIIWWRSTWKSILLWAIAKKLKLEHSPDLEPDYSNYIQSISDKISIFWKDWTENNDREVEYFKQSYIYDLSKNREKLNDIIEKILRQKWKDEEKNKNKELDNYNKFIFDNSKAISSGISDLFQILSDITKTKQNLLDLWDKSWVEKEIEKLNEELKRNSTIQITDEEKIKYEELKKKLEDLINKKNSNNNDFENIEKLKFNSFLKETIDYELISITDEWRKEIIKTFYIKLKEEFNEKWSLKIDEINKKINSDNLEIEKLIKEIIENSIYIKVTKAFTESVQLQEIEKKLKTQKEKLTQIESIIKKIESLDKQKIELIKNIKNLYYKYQTESNIIVSKLSDKVDWLEIKSIIRINEKKYKENLENSLNNIRSENKSALFSTSDKIFEVFDNLIEWNLFFKWWFNAESLSKKIMTENLYEIHYELIYEWDTFWKMSDWKKAFVVLKLLLDFSDKACPILIDQPEDDLDNRSICKELVEYLKKKKKQRQIIVATHNPNVVVTADAEEIIVANQNWTWTPNNNWKKFQYISWSLENTKSLDKVILTTSILNSQWIKEHVCDIVEWGEVAFDLRKKKYKWNS